MWLTRYEGRIRPSYIAAYPVRAGFHRRRRYEGRIRPSYIAAPQTVSARLFSAATTRGEFAPPTLRHRRRPSFRAMSDTTRGEFAPPTLRLDNRPMRLPAAARYEGRIRPSYIAALSRYNKVDDEGNYEGRIRPSYIAAETATSNPGRCGPTRGEFAPPTLRPHPPRPVHRRHPLRGANSPLLHCGMANPFTHTRPPQPTRGEFAPPTLRLPVLR